MNSRLAGLWLTTPSHDAGLKDLKVHHNLRATSPRPSPWSQKPGLGAEVTESFAVLSLPVATKSRLYGLCWSVDIREVRTKIGA